MSEETPGLCARPVGGPAREEQAAGKSEPQSAPQAAQGGNMVRIGKKAPDFTAPAYFNGGFTQVALSHYLGKWVVLCFYPGDFTFV